MGLETALNFQEIGDNVASTGDFVLISSEVNPVVKTLQQRGIVVTAIHSHMLDDDPASSICTIRHSAMLPKLGLV
jgi:hypothetical protein